MSSLESKVKKQFDSKFEEIKKQVTTENSDSEEEKKRPKRAKTSFNLNQEKPNTSLERKRTKKIETGGDYGLGEDKNSRSKNTKRSGVPGSSAKSNATP